MRIIAGSHKGARIFAPKGRETRPTGDRVREAAFNLLGPGAAEDAIVLDLQESRPQLERLRDDEAHVEGWWTIGAEAEWALRCLDGEEDPPLPERDE